MKRTGRNVLKGKIVDVIKGATTAHVKIDIGGAMVTASITNVAVDELNLKSGAAGLCGHQGLRRDGRHRLALVRPRSNSHLC